MRASLLRYNVRSCAKSSWNASFSTRMRNGMNKCAETLNLIRRARKFAPGYAKSRKRARTESRFHLTRGNPAANKNRLRMKPERPLPNQNPPPQYVTVKRDIEVSHGTTKIVIPKGTKLLVVSRASGIVGVLFGNESIIIPESATTEFK